MEGDPKIRDGVFGLEKYVANGNEAVEFKLVKKITDLDEGGVTFHPEMCHQIFNETETIFGYEDLKINVFFTAGGLSAYVNTTYKSVIPKKMSQDVSPDNIARQLEKVLPSGCTTNVDAFSSTIENDAANFKPFGELIQKFSKVWKSHGNCEHHSTNGELNGSNLSTSSDVEMSEIDERQFEIFYCDRNVPGFSDYHKRMESFLLWYIDAANFLDEDERWKFFVLFETYKNDQGTNSYNFCGYASVFEFFAYPDKIRPRIAQMLILPPFQKQGLAVQLLSSIYSQYRGNQKVLEITVEDPSDDFERLRDFVDARDCLKLNSFSKEKLQLGYSKEMLNEAIEKYKMTKRQIHRMYEVAKLLSINRHDDKAMCEFKEAVKKRLNVPYQKRQSDLNRVMKRMKDPTVLESVAQMDDATRDTELESNFKLLLAHYDSIIKRLERYSDVN